MPRIIMTRDLASRASWDEGDRSMHAAGRSTWNEDDYNTAWATFNLLWPLCPHKIAPEDWCFYCDHRAGENPTPHQPSPVN